MLMYAVFRPLIYILSILSLMIVLWFGSRNVFDEIISVGTLYIFSNYIRSFFDPIQELAEQFSTLQSSIASAEKIFTVMDEDEFIPEVENPKQPDKITGKIEFDHVWFAYDGENYVLKDVSFVINPGEKVAFVGATGAGKSSILNLIGRYYDIQRDISTLMASISDSLAKAASQCNRSDAAGCVYIRGGCGVQYPPE